MKNIFPLLFLFLLSPGVVRAQEGPRHELSVYGMGGLSTLHYKLDGGSRKNGFGGGFGLGYAYRFSRHFGLGTGVEVQFYRAQARLNEGFASELLLGTASDPANALNYQTTVFVSRFSEHREKQRAAYLALPLMLRYQSGGRSKFYAAAGVKAAFALRSRYALRTSMTNSVEWAVYEDGNLGGKELFDEQDEMAGTGQYVREGSGRAQLKFALLLSAEAGMKWALSDRNALYTGFYFDWGLNDIRGGRGDLLAYEGESAGTGQANAPVRFGTNSVLASNGPGSSGRVVPLAAGLKIGISFGLGRKAKARPAVAVAPAPVPASVAPADGREEEARRAREAEEARRAGEARRAEAERQEASARQAAREAARAAREREQDMALLLEPLRGYPINIADLDDPRRQQLDDRIALLAKYPAVELTLEGHTCDIDTEAYNLRLGLRRAETVRDYMVGKGIDPGRLAVSSKGESMPEVPNTDEANRRMNRRVVFLIGE